MTLPDTSPLNSAKFVSLTTFRRNGTPVATALGSVQHDSGWACTTGADSGKVKRLRHTTRIEVAPCDGRGTIKDDAPRFRGTGRIITDPSELDTVRSAYNRKYRLPALALRAWRKVTNLFGSTAAQGAIAWSVDEQI